MKVRVLASRFGDFDEERLFYSKYGAGDMFGDGYHPWGSAAVSKRALNKLDQAMQDFGEWLAQADTSQGPATFKLKYHLVQHCRKDLKQRVSKYASLSWDKQKLKNRQSLVWLAEFTATADGQAAFLQDHPEKAPLAAATVEQRAAQPPAMPADVEATAPTPQPGAAAEGPRGGAGAQPAARPARGGGEQQRSGGEVKGMTEAEAELAALEAMVFGKSAAKMAAARQVKPAADEPAAKRSRAA
ncbi:hypothetical protein MNEG_6177 [Monoraphidium neglectum]|uniref:Uncharacterized protein n=1 Tax=Monoraphidium neglectum TaxID=145388 RepID=A0A0D2N7H4_9CHLO|nr:hypothetical protein MNEG_6177 [Monoraphidium neglectum]KIZ01786.1 hypothetical protein MNEG_6177 [Monoraphidium neglectum]|eukprot:XP_013900805.1 hypothetical protein MNEG_6177 [Monoraphidium neglectum]